MKKLTLLALILCCFSVATFAQAFGLRVVNNTGCTVYYRILGGEVCQCGEVYSSNTIALPSGGSAFYPNSTTLGGTFPSTSVKSIVAANVFGYPVCSTWAGGKVGEAPCHYTASFTYRALFPDCSVCATVTANWHSAPHCEGIAVLEFN